MNGRAHFYYGVDGKFGECVITADDVFAPCDADLRAVLAEMEKHLSADGTNVPLTFKAGRCLVSVSVPPGVDKRAAFVNATDTLKHSHGTQVAPG